MSYWAVFMEEIFAKETLSLLSKTGISALLANKTIEEVLQLFVKSQKYLPATLKNVVFQVDEEVSGTPRSGCNDAFSVFAFLAFLLALLQLIQDNGGGRKKRSEECHHMAQPEKRVREGMLAAHIMFQGFLNSVGSQNKHDDRCANWAMCEAGREARKVGRVGEVVAIVARHNAEKYLSKMKNVRWKQVVENEDIECEKLFKCSHKPPHYRFPGIQS